MFAHRARNARGSAARSTAITLIALLLVALPAGKAHAQVVDQFDFEDGDWRVDPDECESASRSAVEQSNENHGRSYQVAANFFDGPALAVNRLRPPS